MNPSDWGPEEVAQQLRSMGLSLAAKKFSEHGITGQQLYGLDDIQLRQIGLTVQQRVTVSNWLKTLPSPSSTRKTPAKARGGASTKSSLPSQTRTTTTTAKRGGAVARPNLGRNDFDPYNDNIMDDPPPQRLKPAAPKRTGAAVNSTKTTATRSTAAPPKRTTTTTGVAKKPSVAETRNRMKNQPPPMMDDVGDTDRVQCRICHRRFASDRIEKHEEICEASMRKKRKVFDSKKQRIGGTEAAKFQRSAKEKNPRGAGKEMINGVPKYKVEHQNLVAALRAARRMTAYEEAKKAGKKVGPPPEMPVIQEMPDDRVQCPYCHRKFGEEQFQRHVNFCSRNAPIPKVSNTKRTGTKTTGVKKAMPRRF